MLLALGERTDDPKPHCTPLMQPLQFTSQYSSSIRLNPAAVVELLNLLLNGIDHLRALPFHCEVPY